MRWAKQWALKIGGVPWRPMVIVTWIAVLPIVVDVWEWTGAPLLPMWICAGLAGVVAVLSCATKIRLSPLTRSG